VFKYFYKNLESILLLDLSNSVLEQVLLFLNVVIVAWHPVSLQLSIHRQLLTTYDEIQLESM